MRKILVFLLLLTIAMPAAGKILIVQGTTTSGCSITRTFPRMLMWTLNIAGVKYRVVAPSLPASERYWDLGTYAGLYNSFVDSLAASGNYSSVWIVNTPDYACADFATDAQMTTAGWPHLFEWITNANSDGLDIPVVLLVGSELCGTQNLTYAFHRSYSGQVEYLDEAGAGDLYESFVTEAGDSVYGKYGSDLKFCSVIGTADTFSTFQTIVSRYTSGRAATNTRWGIMWREYDTDNDHEVLFMRFRGNMTWLWFIAGLSLYERIEPIPMTWTITQGFNAIDANVGISGTAADTVGAGASLKALLNDIKDNDLKVTFSGSVYAADIEAESNGYGEYIVAFANAYPNNVRAVHETWYSADAGGDWLGAYTNRNQASIESAIDSSYSYADYRSDWANISKEPLYPEYRFYCRTSGHTTYRTDHKLKALVNEGVVDVITEGTCERQTLPPELYAIGIQGAKRIWVGSGYDELRMHCGGGDHSTQSLSNDVDTLGAAYRARVVSYMLSWAFGSHMVWDYPGSTTTPTSHGYITSCNDGRKAAQRGLPGQFGHMMKYKFVSHYCSDSTRVYRNAWLVLNYAKNIVDMVNNINETYGHVRQEVFVWSYPDEIMWDRQRKRQFCNSHVSAE